LITKTQKYSGSWFKDKFHKFGVLVEDDGSVYEGDWFLGHKHGLGQLKMADGSVYIGDFEENKFQGKG